jgi:RNA methyltransferase, TrmH family
MEATVPITSRDNPLVKRLRALATDPAAYRKAGEVWLEGDHLVRALLARGQEPRLLVFAESEWRRQAHQDPWPKAVRRVVLADALMQQVSGLESAARMGCVWSLPAAAPVRSGVATVVLDRLQDPGNVGSVLRSAAAMGFEQVLAIKGTAALWSPKVLRAGMGAHFGLNLVEGLMPADLAGLAVPLLVTDVHEGEWVHRARLPWPCAWVLGHEGQGVSAELSAQAVQRLRIAQPGGEESLNVAAAAAICLHASAVARL